MDKLEFILEGLGKKVDKLDSRLDNIDITLISQGKDLNYHIKRSDMLEESLTRVQNQIKPIQKHVDRVDGAIKLIGFIATLVGIIGGIIKIFHIL